MTSNPHPAPQESFSTASAPVTSHAAVENTKVTANKPSKDMNLSISSTTSFMERLTQKNAAAQADFDDRAEKRRKKKDEEKKEINEKNKARNARFVENKQANLFATLKYNSAPAKKQREAAKLQRELSEKKRLAKQKKSKSISKEMGQRKTEPNKNRVNKSNASTKPKQPQLPNAELDSASPVLASASGDLLDHDVKPLASKHLTEEKGTQHPLMANALAAIHEEISQGHSQLTVSQIENSVEFINEICNMNLDQSDEVDLDDIPYEALQKLATWIKEQLAINQAAKDNTGDLEDTQVGQFEQSETQLEKLQSSAPVDGFNKHNKRSLDEDDDEQVTSELSNAHRNKRARSLEPYISPRENNARVTSRRGSLGANAMPDSTYNSVTAYSASVNGGFVPLATGDITPFGADGNAGLKYGQYQQQPSKESHAESKEQDSAKQVQKRRASEPLLEPMAKKLKQSDGEAALLKETEQPTVEPMAETKLFELNDVTKKPEVASSAGDESISFTDTAAPALHTHETATGEVANETETEPTTKEEAESNNDEKKVVEKSDSASGNTSSNTNEHQDATQGDNKTSQTSEEKSAESSSNQTEKSTPKTQDGQKSVKNNASTTTSGSATETTTQQEPAQKSKKNNVQDQVAEVSKTPTKNSDNIDTDDEAQSATEKPAKKKPATTTKPKPQRKVKANDDEQTTTSKKSAAKPTSSAPGVKKSTSKGSAVKQPSKSTQQQPQPRLTGAARFVPTPKGNRPRSAAQNIATDNKRTLADKTNTHRQPTKSDPKKTLAASKNKQLEAANKQPTPATPAASKRRKHNGDDAVESNPKPAEKKQRQEQSKKRSRKDDEDEDEDEDDDAEDDDAGRTKQKSKKQRTNLSSSTTSSQQVPDASTSFQPDRASRSRAAAQQRAATAAAAAAAPRQQATQNTQYDHDLPSGGYDSEDEVQPQSQARTQASGPVDKHEQMAESEQTTSDDAQRGVKDTASGNTGDAEDTSASNGDKPQPQKKEKTKNGFIAHRKGQEPEDPEERKKRKQQESNARVMSEEAQRKKDTEKLFAKDAR